jgi:hypothetical protein
VTPDRGKTALRSRLGRNYRQLPTSERYARAAGCAEIVYLTGYNASEPDFAVETLFLGVVGDPSPGFRPLYFLQVQP